MESSREHSSRRISREKLPVARPINGPNDRREQLTRSKPSVRAVSPESSNSSLPANANQSTVQRLSDGRRMIHWWRERLRESPSLLTSLIIHLAILVVLGSFFVPQSDRNIYDVILVGSMKPAAAELESDVVKLDMSSMVPEEGEASDLNPDAPFATPPPEPAPPKNRNPLNASSTPPATPTGTEKLKDNLLNAKQEISRESFQQFVNDLRSSTSVEDETRQGKYDDIVAKFIQYDIGQLTGEAGRKANTAFKKLGPAAIPALVRGLNRSAYIHNSCPVIELAEKLKKEYKQNKNPKMIEYVNENLGKGVTRNAPYASKIFGLRKQLTGSSGHPAQRAKTLFRFVGIQPTTQQVALMERLIVKAPSMVAMQASVSKDPQIRFAAIVMLQATNFRGVRPRQRIMAGQVAAGLLDSNQPVARGIAMKALSKLAEIFRVQEEDMPSDRTSSAEWKETLKKVETSYVDEPEAFTQMRLADTLLRNGRTEAAVRRFNLIIERFPKTRAAKLVRQRLSKLNVKP